jgi:hypothetical protein
VVVAGNLFISSNRGIFMRWSEVGLFLSDGRIRIVLALVVAAVLIAIFLTYLEIRVKKGREKKKVNASKNYFIEKLQRRIRSGKTTREKIDYLGHVSKSYFHNKFNSPEIADFSELVEFFQKKKQNDISVFCKSMFDAYYSTDYNDALVHSLAKDFIEIFRNLEIRKVEQSPEEMNFVDKIGKVIFTEDVGEKKSGTSVIEDFIYEKFVIVKDFIKKKIKGFFGLFSYEIEEDYVSVGRDWAKNFEDIDKEYLIRNTRSDTAHLTAQDALILKERQILNKKMQRLKEEEKKKIIEVRNLSKREDEDLMFHS